MKKNLLKKSATALAILGLPLLFAACGSKNTGDAAVAPAAPAPYIPPVTTNPIAPVGGGCLPISGPITFAVNGAYADSANIVGGRLPNYGQQVGQSYIGTGNGGGQYYGSGTDGTINMDIQQLGAYGGMPYSNFNSNCYWNMYGYYGSSPGCSGSYPGGGYGIQTSSQVNINGVLSLSPIVQQQIAYQFGGGGLNNWPSSPYPMYGGGNYYNNPTSFPTTPTVGNVCVSGIAFNVGHWNQRIYGGNIYLYLNNTDHGYILYF